MSETNLFPSKLHECLLEELSAMSFLADLLKTEETALVATDVATLNNLTQAKSQQLAALSILEKKRQFYLSHMGYSIDAKGMQDFLTTQQVDRTISENWEKLLDVSASAKETNRTNGILINRQITKNQGALNILQQNNPAGAMYGPNGQSTNKSSSGRGFIVG
ncbi:flagella synthesis protein FlgN [Undibacterium sp. Ren11W]|uniref:flagella synthesis protein FlgN n=1 Tax=Undibacterium sp. Ren11W TaxID=3413045 RepID=UPI003BF3FAD6